jgi:hypothetical protein
LLTASTSPAAPASPASPAHDLAVALGILTAAPLALPPEERGLGLLAQDLHGPHLAERREARAKLIIQELAG